MRRNRGRWWWTVVAGAAIAVSGCESACPRTHLDLTLHGGFGYVLNPDLTVEAGFMKDISTPTCDVKQLGIDLKVDDGTIVSPAGSPLSFPVANAVVTIDGLGTGAVALKGAVGSSLAKANPSSSAATMAAAAASGPGGKTQPMPRTADNDWEDLFWVPHTRLNYSDKRIDPSWRTKAVTGRFVLAGGTLSAGLPSDGAALNGLWEFSAASGHPSYKQALTDRLHYRADILGGQITINITDATGTKKIVVAPIDNRQTVGLILMGRHTKQMPIAIGSPLEHFCTFYQLLESPPLATEQLIPHFTGTTTSTPLTGSSTTTAQPTPGAFCPGDWP